MTDVQRCPACRARLADGPVCGRCGCDLTLALRAESAAGAATTRALRAWADGSPADARLHVGVALALDDTAFGRALRHALETACASLDSA